MQGKEQRYVVGRFGSIELSTAKSTDYVLLLLALHVELFPRFASKFHFISVRSKHFSNREELSALHLAFSNFNILHHQFFISLLGALNRYKKQQHTTFVIKLFKFCMLIQYSIKQLLYFCVMFYCIDEICCELIYEITCAYAPVSSFLYLKWHNLLVQII